MLLIDNNEKLHDFCSQINKEEFITVDLEFMREKTYYAQICLIQVASKNTAAIIDPLAKGLDLSSFWDVMQNEKVIKVFHSCRQDVEIIYNMSGKTPNPLFDTQVAAMVCGFGEYIGYESLVKSLLGRELDKTCRLTNWNLRPLDEGQLEYALSDVTHLVDVYEKLCEILRENHREHWFDEEIAALQNPALYEVNPDDVWQKIRYSSHNSKFLRILQQLAKWRELRAQKHNTPRQSVIKDECLVSIAAMAPKSVEQLAQVRNIRKDVLNGKLAAEILDVVKEAIADKKLKIKPIEKYRAFNSAASGLLELLKLMLKIVSLQEGVVPHIIATDENLRDLAMAENDENNPLLKGWRFDLFGKEALLLREGKISICYNCVSKKIDFNKTA